VRVRVRSADTALARSPTNHDHSPQVLILINSVLSITLSLSEEEEFDTAEKKQNRKLITSFFVLQETATRKHTNTQTKAETNKRASSQEESFQESALFEFGFLVYFVRCVCVIGIEERNTRKTDSEKTSWSHKHTAQTHTL
jgi:hypothetical protein